MKTCIDILTDIGQRIKQRLWMVTVRGNLQSNGLYRMDTIRHYLNGDNIRSVYIKTLNGSIGSVTRVTKDSDGKILYCGSIRPKGGISLLTVYWDEDGNTVSPSVGIEKFKLRYITGLNRLF